ncbi:MAG: hypothetical protein JWP50_661 [Phenylobacterium sp.]|nr:hypothetical protein [Phenylobacterium sp.]
MGGGVRWAGVFAALVLLGGGSSAAAADWAPSAISNKGDLYETDLGTVTRSGDIARSWVRETLVQPVRDERTGKMFVQTIAQRFDDCANRRFSIGSYVHHDRRGADVGSGSDLPQGWQEIVPGSVAEGTWRISCAVSSPPAEKAYLADAEEGTWTDLGPSADQKYHLQVRLDGVFKIDNNLVVALTRSDYAKPEWIGGFPIRHVVTAEAVDCATGKSATLGGDFFMAPRFRVAAQRTPDDKVRLEAATPGSFIANALKLICNSARTVEAANGGASHQGGFSVGTAWGVNKGYLVTASHVIAGGRNIRVFSNGEQVGEARVVADDPANDLAVLKYAPAKPGRLLILPISPRPASLGRSVFTLGYPEPDALGQHVKMTAGQVSSTAGYQDDARYLQISVPVQEGNSGGPLIGVDGAVLGVIEAKLLKFDERKDNPAPEMVNYALKASYIRPMLEDLPDLANYTVIKPQADVDQLVAEARKAVFMVVVSR